MLRFSNFKSYIRRVCMFFTSFLYISGYFRNLIFGGPTIFLSPSLEARSCRYVATFPLGDYNTIM